MKICQMCEKNQASFKIDFLGDKANNVDPESWEACSHCVEMSFHNEPETIKNVTKL